MLRLTLAVLTLGLATSAGAAGWRSMRIDANSEEAFDASVAALKAELPRVRRAVFEQSLIDIWVERTKAAQAAGRGYTASDYLRDLDGLKYKQVVTFTDPSGDTAERYFDQAYVRIYRPRPQLPNAGVPRSPGLAGRSNPPREAGESPRGPRAGQPGVNPWQR